MMLYGILFIFLLSFQLNINSSANNDVIVKEASKLIGSSSSDYPKNSFLMFLLYGHPDVPFSLSGLNSSFRSSLNTPEAGALILGKNNKTSGVFNDSQTFIYANPSSNIEIHPVSDLDQIFVGGYNIRQTRYIPVPYDVSITLKTMNTKDFCTNCEANFLFDINAGTFDQNKFWLLYLFSRIDQYSWTISGYLTSYDPNYDIGIINLIYYDFKNETTGIGYSGFFKDSNNNMNFTVTDNRLDFNMSSVIIVGDMQLVEIQGSWKII